MAGKAETRSPFSVILVMVALSLLGLLSLPRLNVQFLPSYNENSLTVYYALPEASAEIIEGEVTSRLEAYLARIEGVSSVSSVSSKDYGVVYLQFRKGTDMQAARFETLSAVRNIRSELPAGLTYPEVSKSQGREQSNISYQINGDMPSGEIAKYLEENVRDRIATIPGVESVDIYGANSFQWTITFDSFKASSLGIDAFDICDAFNSCYGETLVGSSVNEDGMVTVRFRQKTPENFGDIQVTGSDGCVVHLSDIASWRYEETPPSSYYRINGLNTVTMRIGISAASNLLSASTAVRETMEQLKASFPAQISASMSYDASEYVRSEISKVLKRTALCVLVLLLFVFLTTFSWRYLLIVVLTLTVNILSSLAIYAFAGISVHIYTLAGITVSLGIVIDTSIVMIDHYMRFRNRDVFPSVLAAVATTVGALLLMLLLPEEDKKNLVDFVWVIVTDLALSLLICYIFIPSLMRYVTMNERPGVRSPKALRRIVRRNSRYERYISWGMSHRWLYLLLFVLLFGIPLFALPYPLSDKDKLTAGKWKLALDKVVSWEPYKNNRMIIDRILGSSIGMFYSSINNEDFYREPQQKQLTIRAGMLEGASVAQLNDVVRSMENFLAQYEGISVFTTNIRDYDDAEITVQFKPEYEDTGFPFALKAEVTHMAMNFGGANWQVYGLDENGFDNNIVKTYREHEIVLTGYNYDQLRSYGETLIALLSEHKRVIRPEIWSGHWYYAPNTEYTLKYDFEKMTALGANPYAYYYSLFSPLFEENAAPVRRNGQSTNVVIRSSEASRYDLWHILNSPLDIGGKEVTLSEIGSIEKKRTGVDITRENQSYQIRICYDFLGSYTLYHNVSREILKKMNDEVLALGYKAEIPGWSDYEDAKQRDFTLTLLIIALMYVMLAVTFESFRLPLSVIFMIPVSFIGPFLIFGLTGLKFDQGGFAAFVMLAGIVVNAGIYLVTTWQRISGSSDDKKRRIRNYVKAYSQKIQPISLTIISTILGLIPFLTDGPKEVFWFDFAIGTISGMCISVFAIIFILPVFAVKKKQRVTTRPESRL